MLCLNYKINILNIKKKKFQYLTNDLQPLCWKATHHFDSIAKTSGHKIMWEK